MLIKRSFILSGHATSLALEPEFWSVIEDHARETSQSLTRLVCHIDNERLDKSLNVSLASACRVWALKLLIARLKH